MFAFFKIDGVEKLSVKIDKYIQTFGKSLKIALQRKLT